MSARDVVISNIEQLKFLRRKGNKTCYLYRRSEIGRRECTASPLCASISGPPSFIGGNYCSNSIEVHEARLTDTCDMYVGLVRS